MAHSMDSHESLMETIKSLQELAKQAKNEHEAAAAAAAHVTRLLLKHNLTLDEVEERESDRDPIGEKLQGFTRSDGKTTYNIPTWKKDLINAVSKSCMCTWFYVSGDTASYLRPSKPARFTFVGRKSNVEVAVYLFEYLERSIEEIYSKARASASISMGKDYWSSWLIGAVKTVAERLQAEIDTFQNASEQCRALVKRHLEEARAWMNAHHKLGSGSSSRIQINEDGLSAGSEAAQSISIRQGVGSHISGRKLLN